jgi:gamma-glutamyltranspeptidase/glutathione hydrolase
VPELGIPLQNRGMAFELSQGGLRSLEPGKRPFHTLMPCMLLRDGKPWLVYGSMGGEGQPQTALQLATRIVCDHMDPQAAIEAPRWRWGKDAPHEPARVHIERRIGQACIAGLQARGHDVDVVADWDESMGHAGAIVVDRKEGILTGGADPRGDGAAAGL